MQNNLNFNNFWIAIQWRHKNFFLVVGEKVKITYWWKNEKSFKNTLLGSFWIVLGQR